MTLQQGRHRAVSPVIATIALITVAAAAASIAGSELIRKATLSSSAKPVEISEIFIIKINDSRVLMHAKYTVIPGWTSITATFKDDTGSAITFSLPTDSTVKEYNVELTTHVTIGNRYNLIITAAGSDGNSATIAVPVFVR